MPHRAAFPTTGFALAGICCLGLLIVGVNIGAIAIVLIVWSCSLWLTAAIAPATPGLTPAPTFSHDTMRELIEHSVSPLLISEPSRIAIANLAARQVLGAHVVGQDPRVAFRQPEAVKLLNGNRNGAAVVRGLVRRRDIWRINRQNLHDGMFVIELSNRTAEADISRAHTDFVANASHELRTPLSSIIGYVETLRDSHAELDAPTSQKFLATVSKEARRLQSLVNDLMSLSRVEAEKHDQPDTEVNMAKLVERAARDAAGAERLDRLRMDELEQVSLLGDPQQLEQLVRNLVDNALKYGDPQQQVTLSLDTTSDNYARLMVKDRGDGIDAEHLPHLTRRFYRTDPGRSRASGGTGLGLAIVKHIVERHRGRMDIESVLGTGTTITIRIPTIAETNDEKATPSPKTLAEEAES